MAVIAAMLPGVGTAAASTVPTCQGQRATIVGSPADLELRGTNRADVIVTRGAAAVIAKRGADRICVTGTNRRRGGTDIHAGPGDDRVQVETSRTGELDVDLGDGNDRMVVLNTPARPIHALLGAGKDVYRGGSRRDVVSAETSSRFVYNVDSVDRISTGGGADEVNVGVSVGQTIRDVVDLGAGDDALRVRGWPAAGVPPQGGAGSDHLTIVNCAKDPSTDCVEPRDWVVDNALQVGTVNGGVQTRWSSFEQFDLTSLTAGSVAFNGSDADESLAVRTLAGGAMGLGDDSVVLDRHYGELHGDISGGFGRDMISAFNYLPNATLTIDLTTGAISKDSVADGGRFHDFENASAWSEGSVTMIGDGGDNTLWAASCFVTETGGAGDDVLTTAPDNRFDDCDYFQPGVTFDGGPGADVLRGGWGPDHLDGGEGDDTAYGSRGTDVCLAEVRFSCEQ